MVWNLGVWERSPSPTTVKAASFPLQTSIHLLGVSRGGYVWRSECNSTGGSSVLPPPGSEAQTQAFSLGARPLAPCWAVISGTSDSLSSQIPRILTYQSNQCPESVQDVHGEITTQGWKVSRTFKQAQIHILLPNSSTAIQVFLDGGGRRLLKAGHNGTSCTPTYLRGQCSTTTWGQPREHMRHITYAKHITNYRAY